MKILILIPLYKRPEIWKICIRNLKRFIRRVSWQIEVVCILSPDDDHMKTNENLCKLAGFKCIYYPNFPVSDKINAGIRYIMAHYEFDYLMNFGSDDLIHPDIEQLYDEHFKLNRLFFGINTLYFYDYDSKKAIFFDTYNTNGAIGAGRMIHKSILDMFHTDMMPLYEPGINQGMDTNSAMMIKRSYGIYEVIVDSGEFPYIVDIKSNTNINYFVHLEERTKNIKQVETNYLHQYFIL